MFPTRSRSHAFTLLELAVSLYPSGEALYAAGGNGLGSEADENTRQQE